MGLGLARVAALSVVAVLASVVFVLVGAAPLLGGCILSLVVAFILVVAPLLGGVLSLVVSFILVIAPLLGAVLSLVVTLPLVVILSLGGPPGIVIGFALVWTMMAVRARRPVCVPRIARVPAGAGNWRLGSRVILGVRGLVNPVLVDTA